MFIPSSLATQTERQIPRNCRRLEVDHSPLLFCGETVCSWTPNPSNVSCKYSNKWLPAQLHACNYLHDALVYPIHETPLVNELERAKEEERDICEQEVNVTQLALAYSLDCLDTGRLLDEATTADYSLGYTYTDVFFLFFFYKLHSLHDASACIQQIGVGEIRKALPTIEGLDFTARSDAPWDEGVKKGISAINGEGLHGG